MVVISRPTRFGRPVFLWLHFRVDDQLIARLLDREAAFAVFGDQDSGSVSYGVEADGVRYFVKTPTTPAARESLTRAVALHAAVRHDAIVRPLAVLDGPVLVYPWHEGTVLNAATRSGSDRSGLARFQALPLPEVLAALDTILAAHRALAGFVPVDLYDGCFLYDFDARVMRLIDLDEYRPAFTLEADRLPGSTRYMAPEERVRGSRIDERTGVFVLGRVLLHLLDSPSGGRGDAAMGAVIARATEPDPADRWPSVEALATAWAGVSPPRGTPRPVG
jgi:serine/threonine-protein kinase